MGRPLQLCSHRWLSCILRAVDIPGGLQGSGRQYSSEINGEKGLRLADGGLDQGAYGRGEGKGRGPRHILEVEALGAE